MMLMMSESGYLATHHMSSGQVRYDYKEGKHSHTLMLKYHH